MRIPNTHEAYLFVDLDGGSTVVIADGVVNAVAAWRKLQAEITGEDVLLCPNEIKFLCDGDCIAVDGVTT